MPLINDNEKFTSRCSFRPCERHVEDALKKSVLYQRERDAAQADLGSQAAPLPATTAPSESTPL